MSTLSNAMTLLGSASREPRLLGQMVGAGVHRMRADERAYGLKRDLEVPHTAPEALVPIDVRPIRDEDVPHILESGASLTPEERFERTHRSSLLRSGAGTCFVAVTSEDVPCYIQWLFSSRDNDFLQRHFHGSFPVLDADTALLEGAYTPTASRGQRIMSAAMSRIAEQAGSVGACYVVTFVGVDNEPSLKGCQRAGFERYVERVVRWRLLRSSVTFRALVPS